MKSQDAPRSNDPDSPSAIRQRGATGAALLTVRAVAAQAVAFAGTLVLAHLLLPRTFGAVALGAIIVTTGNFLADGGLGAALVRQPSAPTSAELRTLLAVQLAAARALGVVEWGCGDLPPPRWCALAGSVLMTLASPLGVMSPRVARGSLRSMLGFGLGFQAVGVAAVVTAQGVNLAVAWVGGVQLLGYWSLANRLLQVPFWLFQALWGVSYPMMARLRAIGEDTRPTVRRFAGITALATGAILAPLAASAHDLVPALFGHRWAPAAAPLPWASAGLLVGGPISVAAAGYLYAGRDVRTPLTATAVNGAVWVGLTVVLLRPFGIAAVGVAWMLASWTESVIFARALRRRAQVSLARFMAIPVAAAYTASGAAYLVGRALPSGLPAAVVTAAVALAAYLALNLAFNRSALFDTARRIRSIGGGVVPQRSPR